MLKKDIPSMISQNLSKAGEYSIQQCNNKYIIYKFDEVNNKKFISKRFITTDKVLVIKLLVHHYTDRYIWDEVCRRYGGSFYIEYTDDVIDFEHKLLHKILKYIPEQYREFDLLKDIKFESFIDSEEYKVWLGNQFILLG